MIRLGRLNRVILCSDSYHSASFLHLHLLCPVQSSPEIPAPRDALVRHNSCGEKYVHTVHGPSGSSSILSDVFPSPLHGLTDPKSFTIRGVLELGVKNRGKKKLCWEPRIARVRSIATIFSMAIRAVRTGIEASFPSFRFVLYWYPPSFSVKRNISYIADTSFQVVCWCKSSWHTNSAPFRAVQSPTGAFPWSCVVSVRRAHTRCSEGSLCISTNYS